MNEAHHGGMRDKCIKGNWNHRFESHQAKEFFNCSEFINDYFFVSRECTQDSCLERLIRGDVVYKEILFVMNE